MMDLKFNSHGLIPVIAQDVKNNEVLMMAYMDKDALKQTLETGKACYYSRSRKKYWTKGESSGHLQHVKEILTDCDRDTLLLRVEQIGGACHLGYRTCFVHQLDEKGEFKKITQEKVFNPEDIYKKENPKP
jgi:phosphoribosyl-AMP cyclohydrolase